MCGVSLERMLHKHVLEVYGLTKKAESKNLSS